MKKSSEYMKKSSEQEYTIIVVDKKKIAKEKKKLKQKWDNPKASTCRCRVAPYQLPIWGRSGWQGYK